MARDVNDTVVLGFGSWSDVYGLPTLGFGSGVEQPITAAGLTAVVRPNKLQVTVRPNVLAATVRPNKLEGTAR